MEKQLINEIREKVCIILQSKSRGTKDRSISKPLVFRTLANKKLFPYEIEISEEDVSTVNVETPEFVQFVLQINPFFKFSDKEKDKLNYYKKYYFISNLIYEDLRNTFDQRKDVKYYSLYDITNNIDIKFKDFKSTKDNSFAIYDTYEEAITDLKKYCSAYKSLGLEQNVAIRKHNLLNEVLEEVIFSVDDL